MENNDFNYLTSKYQLNDIDNDRFEQKNITTGHHETDVVPKKESDLLFDVPEISKKIIG